MENENLSAPDYLGVLIQWLLLFFAILAILLVPAFALRKLALKHNKKGWLFFLMGLAVGGVALNVMRAISYLRNYFAPDQSNYFLILVALSAATLFSWIAFRVLKNIFFKPQKAN